MFFDVLPGFGLFIPIKLRSQRVYFVFGDQAEYLSIAGDYFGLDSRRKKQQC